MGYSGWASVIHPSKLHHVIHRLSDTRSTHKSLKLIQVRLRHGQLRQLCVTGSSRTGCFSIFLCFGYCPPEPAGTHLSACQNINLPLFGFAFHFHPSRSKRCDWRHKSLGDAGPGRTFVYSNTATAWLHGLGQRTAAIVALLNPRWRLSNHTGSITTGTALTGHPCI